MHKLLLASGNKGKLIEIRNLLAGLDLELVIPGDLEIDLQVAEVGTTYAENAALKAQAFSQATGLVTLADDSGLEVDCLDGAPGLHSARFSPQPGATDADRRRYLLDRLSGCPPPWTAQFRCSVALAQPDGPVTIREGNCSGIIVAEERGQNGFGYDPIFWIPEAGRTMAELGLDEKNRMSHRAQAVKAALPDLRRLFELER